MPELDKIIGALNCFKDQCLSGTLCDHKCDYRKPAEDFGYCDFITAIDDAVALLKSHEPRVMTLDEARFALKNNDVIWAEDKDSGVNAGIKVHDETYFEMQTGEIIDVYDLDDDEYSILYGKSIRFWTLKPTEEQQNAEAWE